MKATKSVLKFVVDIIAVLIAVAFIVFLILMLIDKMQPSDSQKAYHEGVEDIEHYVLDSMGIYIVFCEPEFDEYTVVWEVDIRESYTRSDKDKTYEEISNDTVSLIEDYLLNHPDHLLNSYDLYITVWVNNHGDSGRLADYYISTDELNEVGTYGYDFPGDLITVNQIPYENSDNWRAVLDSVNEYRNSQEYSTDDLDIRRERIVEILSNLDGDYVLESSIDSTSIPECVSGVTQDGISFRIGIMDPEWYETHNG